MLATVPATVEKLPTAHMSVGDVAEMPVSTAGQRLPGRRAGSARDDRPGAAIQCSTRAKPVRLLPTTPALVPLKSTTPSKMDLADPSSRDGHDRPGRSVPMRRYRVRRRKLVWLVDPTAHASVALAALTARSFSSKKLTFGVGTWLHVEPFHRSASMTLPSCRFGP